MLIESKTNPIQRCVYRLKSSRNIKKHYYPNGPLVATHEDNAPRIQKILRKVAQSYTWNRTLSLWLAQCDKQRQERERNWVWFWCILRKNDRRKRREESRSQRYTVEKALQLEDFNANSQSEQSTQKREIVEVEEEV